MIVDSTDRTWLFKICEWKEKNLQNNAVDYLSSFIVPINVRYVFFILSKLLQIFHNASYMNTLPYFLFELLIVYPGNWQVNLTRFHSNACFTDEHLFFVSCKNPFSYCGTWQVIIENNVLSGKIWLVIKIDDKRPVRSNELCSAVWRNRLNMCSGGVVVHPVTWKRGCIAMHGNYELRVFHDIWINV